MGDRERGLISGSLSSQSLFGDMHGNEQSNSSLWRPNFETVLNLMQCFICITYTLGDVIYIFLCRPFWTLFGSHFKEEVMFQEHHKIVCHCYRNIVWYIKSTKTCLTWIYLHFSILHIQRLSYSISWCFFFWIKSLLIRYEKM